MSQSKDSKTQTKAERNEKRRQEEQADRRSMAIYTVVGVAVVVVAIAMLVWTSGILQRNLTAVEISGSKYTAADVEYYFNSTYTNTVNFYMSQYFTTPFDTKVSTQKQVYDQESGQTWHDYLMEEALKRMESDAALAAKAAEENYTLSEKAQAEIDSSIAQLNTTWLTQGYPSRNAYIHAIFGAFMDYDRLLELLKLQVTASDYAQSQLDAIDHSQADYDNYYTQHADELDTYTMSQFLFQARVATTDEQGNPIEMTQEEMDAALETAKAEQKALAEELQAKLEAGADPAALAEEYGEQLYSSNVSRQAVGSNLAGLAYYDWAIDASRQPNDITLAEYDTGTAYNYYVVRFEDRQLDTTPTANIRHILVAAEQDEGAEQPTQEQYDAAYVKAEELLEQWKAGEATEESFAAMATEHSADTGSAANGGMISNISPTSGYVDTFSDWALNPSREIGDVEIVQNTGSSIKGWHIMYYASTGEPIWKQTTAAGMEDEDYEEMVKELTDALTVTQSVGMKLLSAK